MVITQHQGNSWKDSSAPEAPHSPAEAFLQALFGNTPADQYLEIRTIPPIGRAQQHFVHFGDLQSQGWRHIVPLRFIGDFNIYFGVCPRVRCSGKKADVSRADCLWADIDHGWPDAWPESMPPPSAIVESSPGKYQVFWFLTEATHDLTVVEQIEDGLAATFGGDPAATDCARVLRLPGFPNLKYDSRPLSRLVELHSDRRFPLEQFEWLIPPCPTGNHNSNSRRHIEVNNQVSSGSRPTSRAKSEGARQEFRRLMAKLGVIPGDNPTWCFAHDDKREGGRASLSVDWQGCQFKCHSPRCGVHGGIAKLRRLAGETPPFVARMSSYEQEGVSERDRLVMALRDAGEAASADAVQSCHRDYRAYRCRGCGKTPAYPISCGLPLCPACMASRFFAFWEKHKGKLEGPLSLVLLTRDERFPLAKAAMKKARERFKEWRQRRKLECGLYALMPVVDGEQCRLSILLVIPQSEVGKIGEGRAFQVQIAADHSTERDACSWLADSLLRGATSWRSTTEMLALWSMLKGTPLVFGFGQWHAVRGGRCNVADKEKPACPFCGGELMSLGIVPRNSIAVEDGHSVWHPPPAVGPKS